MLVLVLVLTFPKKSVSSTRSSNIKLFSVCQKRKAVLMFCMHQLSIVLGAHSWE